MVILSWMVRIAVKLFCRVEQTIIMGYELSGMIGRLCLDGKLSVMV